MPHLSSEKIQRSYYFATSFSPSRIRNFVSYFIHNTLWAYPNVTQLIKLMLLTFSFYTSFGRRLLTSPTSQHHKIGFRINPRPYCGIWRQRISEKCDTELLTEKEKIFSSFLRFSTSQVHYASLTNANASPVTHHISILFVLDSEKGHTLIIDFNHYDQQQN